MIVPRIFAFLIVGFSRLAPRSTNLQDQNFIYMRSLTRAAIKMQLKRKTKTITIKKKENEIRYVAKSFHQ